MRNDSSKRWTKIIAEMKQRLGLHVRKWRTEMSGCAWQIHFRNGRIENWIESPLPRSAVSLAVFLHECGHHAIGFDKYKKRCEEEYHVWMWAIDRMKEFGIEPDDAVNRRVELSMHYAVDKAMRRGMKSLPEPLMRYVAAAA